jgi:hypothetical protein
MRGVTAAMVFGQLTGTTAVAAATAPAQGRGEYSHGLNERIEVASFHAGLAHWYRLLKDLAGAKH